MSGTGRSELVAERILSATAEQVGARGVGATTVEDVARRAGVSRATVYRYFPGGRRQLLEALVAWEHARFLARLSAAVQSARSLVEVMERGLSVAHRAVADHEVLRRMLETEPGILLATLSVESRPTRELIAAFLVPFLTDDELLPGVDVEEAADFLARMAISYVAAPGRWDLDDPDQVARLVRAELLAGVVPPARRVPE